MTLDEIVQKIYEEYEERYQDPSDHMIREVVERALALARGFEDVNDICARTFSTNFPRDLYGACARAFGTTREDAKARLLKELYGEHEQEKKQ